MKKIISSFILLLLLLTFNGCIPKQADGKYHSQYSYHPYFKMYNNNRIIQTKHSLKSKKSNYYNEEPRYQTYREAYHPPKIKIPKKKLQRIIKRVKYNDEDNYPSNVPTKGY